MDKKQKIICLLQARMGSTRLPQKVLKPIIDNIPSLYLQWERISPSTKVDKIVVATSHLPQDDVIEHFCNQWKIPVFRGDEQNVLSRFYEAAVVYQADVIVRITADSPLHHYKVIDWSIEQYQKLNVDYFSNSNVSNSNEPLVLEDGWVTEVFSFNALKTAYFEAQKNSEKEHVTPYIKSSGKFKCHYQKYLSDNPNNYKLSLDTEDDYRLIQIIFKHFYPNLMFEVNEVVKLLQDHPHLLEINKNSVINAGYQKSLEEENKNKNSI